MTLTLPTPDAGDTARQRFALELLLQQPVPGPEQLLASRNLLNDALPDVGPDQWRALQAMPIAIGADHLNMLAIGEETGEMDKMLSKVADFYEDEVGAMVKALTSMLEPAMIVVVGGIVGSILLAMYLPMFTVFDQIQ